MPQFASTSIDEELAIQIYPNPTTDFINIKTENATLIENIEIKAMDGTSVLTQKETEKITYFSFSCRRLFYPCEV